MDTHRDARSLDFDCAPFRRCPPRRFRLSNDDRREVRRCDDRPGRKRKLSFARFFAPAVNLRTSRPVAARDLGDRQGVVCVTFSDNLGLQLWRPATTAAAVGQYLQPPRRLQSRSVTLVVQSVTSRLSRADYGRLGWWAACGPKPALTAQLTTARVVQIWRATVARISRLGRAAPITSLIAFAAMRRVFADSGHSSKVI